MQFNLYTPKILHWSAASRLNLTVSAVHRTACDSSHFKVTFLGFWIVSEIKLSQISLERKFPESYWGEGENVAEHLDLNHTKNVTAQNSSTSE